jgi:predicted ATPase
VYEWGGEKPLDAGWNGEQAIPALLASRTVSQVAKWLQEMKLIHSFRLESVGESQTIYQCHVKTTPTATEVLLPDVGFGVSQILPVLADCAMLPEGSTLLLEQPEIHLHPFAQAALADILIDAIKDRKLQIIVESHSEHLLRRIQRRIAREVIHRDDVALYFCHLENGSSAIEELDVDAYGNIRNWPTDFFGDEMGELADMTVAAMERQKAGSQ